MEPSDAVRIGRAMAAKVCAGNLWVDDVAQAATIAAWEHPDHAVRAAYFGAVNELRRLTCARRYPAPERRPKGARWVDKIDSIDRVEIEGQGSDRDVTLADTLAAPEAHEPIDVTGLKPHEAKVAVLLSLGFSKTDTAEILGVTQGAISYTLRGLRRRGTDGIEAA